MNSFGENLKIIRKSKGISQKKLANDLEISQGTIANYEKDNRFPKEKIMRKLADYFEVSVDYLIGRAEKKEENIYEDNMDLKNVKFIDFSIIDDSFYTFALAYYYDLVIKNDLESAYYLLYKIYQSGGKLIDIYNNIIIKSLNKIGDLWEVGELDVITEHHFTAATESIIARLDLIVKKKNTLDKRVMCMCVNNEKHVIGCRMLSYYVDYIGASSYYVGANVPYEFIEDYVKRNKIDVIVISITMREHEKELDDLIKYINSNNILNNVEIVLAGSFFKDPIQIQKYNKHSKIFVIEDIVDILGK